MSGLGLFSSLSALLLAFLAPPFTSPTAAQFRGCDDPGRALPVVLVHGFTGDQSAMEFLDRGLSARDDFAVSRFDYRDANRQWVTDSRIGPALARVIGCLAERSASAGGPGKVAVVAHSMGGLAAREAARQVGDRLVIAVTIATPHLGSFLAGPVPDWGPGKKVNAAYRALVQGFLSVACPVAVGLTLGTSMVPCEWVIKLETPAARAMAVGSRQLSRLPPFPPDLPVLTIAGDISLVDRFFFFERRTDTLSDPVVDVHSATVAQAHPERGGGEYLVDCELFWMPPFPGGECAHGALLEHPKVLRRIVRALEEASLPPPELRPDGLGALRFGSPANAAERTIRSSFGRPSSDTGWEELVPLANPDLYAYGDRTDFPNLAWDYPYYRRLCWQQLCVISGGEDPDSASFTGWSMSVFETHSYEEAAAETFAAVPNITTAGGLSVGTTYEELQRLHPGVVILQGEGNALGFDIDWPEVIADGVQSGTGRIEGQWSHAIGGPEIRPDDQVQSLSAGDGPSPTCC